MKKIWFTEFGFPSIDKATNQPNVFFDPACQDGGVPKYSSGEVDFSIQRRAIKAFIEYWQQQEYIEQLFLWAWDARPYPAWPHMNIWRDGHLWERGHWVNHKFGTSTIASILLELSARCGITSEKIEVSTLDEPVEGMLLGRQIAVIDAINILRIGYFFDLVASGQNKICFIKRGQSPPDNINAEMLIKLSSGSYLWQRKIGKENIINQLGLSFIDRSKDYTSGYYWLSSENVTNKSRANIKLPVVLSDSEALRLSKLILRNAAIEDRMVKFNIPACLVQYQPADMVVLNYADYRYQIRIIALRLQKLTLEVTGIVDDFVSYHGEVVAGKPSSTVIASERE